MAKPKIFVSHSTLDNAFATKLVNDLKAAGAEAWMDVNDLGAGNFQQHISEALENCEWFLLVLTPNALASNWVRMEVDAAIRFRNQGKIQEVILVKSVALNLSELPALWGVFNVIDATVNYANYKVALNWILKVVGLPTIENIPQSVAAHGTSNAPLEYWMLGAALDHADNLYKTGRPGEALELYERVLAGQRADGKRNQNLAAAHESHVQVWKGITKALNALGRIAEATEAERRVKELGG